MTLFLDGARCVTDVVRDGLERDIVYERGGEPPLTVGRRFRDHGFAGGRVAQLEVYDRALTGLEVRERFEPGSLDAAFANPSQHRAGAARVLCQ